MCAYLNFIVLYPGGGTVTLAMHEMQPSILLNLFFLDLKVLKFSVVIQKMAILAAGNGELLKELDLYLSIIRCVWLDSCYR